MSGLGVAACPLVPSRSRSSPCSPTATWSATSSTLPTPRRRSAFIAWAGRHLRRRDALDRRDDHRFPGAPARQRAPHGCPTSTTTEDVLCRSRRGRPLPKADPAYRPWCRIHLPACNEPPELLIQTIQAAEADRLPGLRDPRHRQHRQGPGRLAAGRGLLPGPAPGQVRARRPVARFSRGPQPGPAPVHRPARGDHRPDRRRRPGPAVPLRETVPYFCDPDIGFVQTFEGNREFEGSPYYTACVDSYQASTCQTCPPEANATRSRSWARWACSAAAR